MNVFRKLHPLLLSTWLTLHVVAGLILLSSYAASNVPGMFWSLQETYRRVKSVQEVPSWLPNDFVVTLLASWLVTTLTLYVASHILHRLCSRYCDKDHALEALHWIVFSPRIRNLFLLNFALTVTTIAIPVAAVPLVLVSLVALALAVYQPFLEAQQLPRDSKSVRRATRSFFLLVFTSLVFLVLSFGVSWLVSRGATTVQLVMNVVWYVFQSALEGLLLAVVIFDIELLRTRVNLGRFFSIRYLVTWVRLDYLGLLMFLWLAPPLVLLAVFMWFAYPSIRYDAQVNGVAVSWWVSNFASAADALRKNWYMALPPMVLVFATTMHAKIVFELEKTAKTRGVS